MLQAPPGAGKTTRVPLALLDEPWLASQRIVMLEPRRLAARAAAFRMASLLDERVGATVGYRVRRDTRVGRTTRIEVVTEGVLTRIIQSDAALDGVGLVVFDEFHERSLHADLGLALALQSQALLREDLRLLVMSATLEGGPIARLLGSGAGKGQPAPIITSEGRSHAVETRYLPAARNGPVEGAVVAVIRRALSDTEGDLLVFLPGAGEIHRTVALLASELLGSVVDVLPLFGDLAQEAQDRAIAPAPPGRRKIVLATSIAETSLTIEGVGVVIDGGLMRVPRFSPRTGLSGLVTVPVTADAADQRRGRAGRLGPGTCYRLWTEREQLQLVPRRTPEILAADLAPLAMELAVWGVRDPGELAWLDAPPPAALGQARELLEAVGATAGGLITPHGRAMAELGAHPRVANMLLRATAAGRGGLACELAALVTERDIFRRGEQPADPDLRTRLDALARGARDGRLDRAAMDRVTAEARHWRTRLSIAPGDRDGGDVGAVLALAYPDRVAQRRGGGAGRFLLRGGRGAVLVGDGPLAQAPYLVASDLDDRGSESRIYRAAPLEEAELREIFAREIEREDEVTWDSSAGAVVARWRERLGAIVLREGSLHQPDEATVAAALVGGIEQEGLGILPWSRGSRQLRDRISFLRQQDSSWPDVSDPALIAGLRDWLGPHLLGMRRREDLRRLDLDGLLLEMIGWERRRVLDEAAPTHLTVPTGSRIPIDYGDPQNPSVAVRLQEVFGLTRTPAVAGGRVPLTLQLLSPAQRPVQVTRDLESFWREGYFAVRKDLRGRYPKHSWPDDPLTAQPTRRARRREDC